MYKLQVSVALQLFRLRPVRLRARSCWYMSNWYINNGLHLAQKYARIFCICPRTLSVYCPKDKYASIFSQPKWGYCVYYPSVLKIGAYLVNKPLSAAGISADNVRGWEIVPKMNIWPRSEASRANVKFWRQSLSQGHYQPIYQQAGKGFIWFITLPLIFFLIKPRVNMVKKPVVIWWRMRAWLTWGSKSKFDWFN